MNRHSEGIRQIRLLITPPAGYSNGGFIQYEGSAVQKSLVGIAQDLSSFYPTLPPCEKDRQGMLRRLPSSTEILAVDEVRARELLELRSPIAPLLAASSVEEEAA